jgi:hypothetical protein
MKHLWLMCLLAVAPCVLGQNPSETLTNGTIIKLVQAGVPPETIIRTIAAADKVNFSFLPSDLQAFAYYKVPEEVFKAMAAKDKGRPISGVASALTAPAQAPTPTPAQRETASSAPAARSQRPSQVKVSSDDENHVPRVEVFAGYATFRPYLPGNLLKGPDGPAAKEIGEFVLGNVLGWGASATLNVNRWFGVTGDFGGHYRKLGSIQVSGSSGQADANLHTFLGGPKFTLRRRISPFAHALFGVGRVSASASLDRDKIAFNETGFVMAIGGGVDGRIYRNFSARLIEFDYFPYRHTDGETFVFKNIRWRSGIVFSF